MHILHYFQCRVLIGFSLTRIPGDLDPEGTSTLQMTAVYSFETLTVINQSAWCYFSESSSLHFKRRDGHVSCVALNWI
jgi:hypothetical protein